MVLDRDCLECPLHLGAHLEHVGLLLPVTMERALLVLAVEFVRLEHRRIEHSSHHAHRAWQHIWAAPDVEGLSCLSPLQTH